MFRTSVNPIPGEVFSFAEVARAAGLSRRHAVAALRTAGIPVPTDYLDLSEAVHLTRLLAGRFDARPCERSPLTLPPEPRRRALPSLAASGALHVLFLLAITAAATLGLLARDTEELVIDRKPVHLVYMMLHGPGGGGGGGGLRMPAPPPRAEKPAPPKPVSSPVPPIRRRPPPPPVRRPPPRPLPARVEPIVMDRQPPRPLPALEAVMAPVVPVPADTRDITGLPDPPPAPPSASLGPGSGGGVGQGAGTGLGEGSGGGIGPGSGGGTGGGPYQPGSGIAPPMLRREVRPSYTDDARRRAIEGDVVLEIVVLRDGTVGSMKVRRSLDRGLDQRAMEAVRQWRFGPATRQGTPVDVVVEVSVEFKLR